MVTIFSFFQLGGLTKFEQRIVTVQFATVFWGPVVCHNEMLSAVILQFPGFVLYISFDRSLLRNTDYLIIHSSGIKIRHMYITLSYLISDKNCVRKYHLQD